MTKHVLEQMQSRKQAGIKSFALLLDPDHFQPLRDTVLLRRAEKQNVHYIFVGGSLVQSAQLSEMLQFLKANTSIPVILFPGSVLQVNAGADALFFLSLISGRNAELLIGNHVIAAPYIRKTNLEVIPTGYMLIDSGRQTTASYMSQTQPIPHDKPDIAKCTAMAGEMLGLKVIYMDGGSGAMHSIHPEMIQAVHEAVDIPLIVGGGIRSAAKANELLHAGADIIVVGNALEQDTENALLEEITQAVMEFTSH
jgi:phosphoglycerol geranylgeranyltransferase